MDECKPLGPTSSPCVMMSCPAATAAQGRAASAGQSDKISHIDTVISYINTDISHIDTVILRSSSISILSSCHPVDRMTRSYLVTLVPATSLDVDLKQCRQIWWMTWRVLATLTNAV